MAATTTTGRTTVSDQSHDLRDDGMPVAEAARVLGITEGAVRKRVERGKLKADHAPDGRLVVYPEGVNSAVTTTDMTHDRMRQSRDTGGGDARYTRSLEDQVEYLRRQLEEERESRRRADTIIAQLSQANVEQARTIRALEAPKSESPREWTVDEEVAREDEGMEGRQGVSDEQQNYERYVQPYEDTESPETVEEEQGRVEPRSAAGEAQEGVQRPWWRRVFGG